MKVHLKGYSLFDIKDSFHRAHIMITIRVYDDNKSISPIDMQRIRTDTTWFETKWNITRNAVNQLIRKTLYASG